MAEKRHQSGLKTWEGCRESGFESWGRGSKRSVDIGTSQWRVSSA